MRSRFAGNVTYNERHRSGRGGAAGSGGQFAGGDRCPHLTPQAVRKERNQPAFVAHTVAFLAELRRGIGIGAGHDGGSAMRPACSGW